MSEINLTIENACKNSDGLKRVKATTRFGYIITQKIKRNRLAVGQIDDYLKAFDIYLPLLRKSYKEEKESILQFDAYGDALEAEFGELINMRYAMTETKGYYAEFAQPGNTSKVQPLSFWYSHHRLDYVWNFRKSQIIRTRYYNFLQIAKNDWGALVINSYHPVHLTLTVPHIGGKFQGKRFYAREVIKLFTAMRKMDFWNKMIYAGEYGLEVKKSKQHGLHIHLHSLVLQHTDFSVNVVRDRIIQAWRELTNNETGYSGLHYETLFTWKKDADGNVLTEPKKVKDRFGNLVDSLTETVPVKDYIDYRTAEVSHYLAGVMECIKYHFKPDCIEVDSATHQLDLDLIKEILNNTKGLRMYSRFGQFYKQPDLNFNQIDKEATEFSDEDVDEEVKANVSGVEARMINPVTFQPAKREDYKLFRTHPNNLRYKPKDSDIPHEPYAWDRTCFAYAPPTMNLKEFIRADIRGTVSEEVFKQEAKDIQPFLKLNN